MSAKMVARRPDQFSVIDRIGVMLSRAASLANAG